jgi:hypothetical protein
MNEMFSVILSIFRTRSEPADEAEKLLRNMLSLRSVGGLSHASD